MEYSYYNPVANVMSEFDSIPRHLKEGLPSAASFEEGARRDYQIHVEAWGRGIPQESLSNPTVYHYASVLRDVDAAQSRDDLTDPYLNSRRAIERPTPNSEEEQRIRQYRLLTMLSGTLLTEGFPGSRHYYVSDVGRYLDHLLKPFGTIAENVFEHEEYEPVAPATGMWSRGSGQDDRYPDNEMEVSEAAAGKYQGWWIRPETLVERDDPEHQALIEEEVLRQGLDPRSPRANEVYPSLSRLVYARQVQDEVSDVPTLLPAPGLTPAVPERLARVAPLLTLATRTLAEQFRPGKLAPTEILSALAPVARTIGRRIL